MKILRVDKFLPGTIMVTIEGYEDSQPVFEEDISEEDLIQGIKDWKVRYDEAKALDELPQPAEPPVPHKDLEGKEIEENVSIEGN